MAVSDTFKFTCTIANDFTIGFNQPPRKDKGFGSATRVKAVREWDGEKIVSYNRVLTDHDQVDRVMGNDGLSFEELRSLNRRFYDSIIEKSASLPEHEKNLLISHADLAWKRFVSAGGSAKDLGLDGLPPLGLSTATNSHKIPVQRINDGETPSEQRFPSRAKRGSKGLPSSARRQVRGVSALLEKKYGRRKISLATFTLPTLDPVELLSLESQWAELTRVFFQRLKRLCLSRGLSGDYLQVTEVQEKRYLRWGQVCLHFHVLFPGRLSDRGPWLISADDCRSLWGDVLSHFLGRLVDVRSATRIEVPKTSLAKEMGKYLSKGGKLISRIVEAGHGVYLPSSWWGASSGLKRDEKAARRTRTGEPVNRLLQNLKKYRDAGLVWFREIWLEVADPVTGSVREKWIGVSGRFADTFIADMVCSGLDPLDQSFAVAA